MRAPFQILVIPYRFIGDIAYFCIFHRSDSDVWQFVTGGGEDNELLIDAAKREIHEEIGVKVSDIFRLNSHAYLPITVVNEKCRAHWDKNKYVIPEVAFAFECISDITLSEEHNDFMWLPYDEALEKLRYDSNKTALFELNCILCNKKHIIGNRVFEVKISDNPIMLFELTNSINSVLVPQYRVKIKPEAISEWLLDKGFMELYVTEYGAESKRVTESGLRIGICSKNKVVKERNMCYTIFLYNKEVQQFIVDNLSQIIDKYPHNIENVSASGMAEAKIPEMDELYVSRKFEHGDMNI